MLRCKRVYFAACLALPRAGHCLFERRKITVSLKVTCMGWLKNALFVATHDEGQGHLVQGWVVMW